MNRIFNKNSKKNGTLPKGFTLVEVLVAIVVLAIGVLAVSRLTVMGIRTSTLMNRRMYARDVLNRYHEELMGLPTNDSILRYITSGGLDDTLTPDYEVSEAVGGGVFRILWNIADSMIVAVPDPRFKTVRIHVLWLQAARPISSDLIKRY
ncbi:MAG: prepilin-type N-terminal cleavage/methylation domain-containing protein [candidate division WOR-3 bacterium]|nr:MAG: prepilin-type N-terminal cleavage/methylation domain-containing protein [candidate division WOR-3 bacterium]